MHSPGDWLDGLGELVRLHNNPVFFPAPKNSLTSGRLTPSPITHNILSSKNRKMSQPFSNNINSFNTSVNFAAPDERSNILTWLSPLDPKLRHQSIRDRRVKNVGEWLFKTEEFASWHAGHGGHESDNRALCCFGDPGVGKTFIR